MQLKKNPRDSRYGSADSFSEGVIPVGFEDEEQTVSTEPTTFQPPRDETPANPMMNETAAVVTRQREAAPAQQRTVESVIDANSSFDGKFETDQDLRVEGSIGGEVVCRGRFTVEKDATARAKIQARDAVIRGRVEGDIACSGRLELAGTAIVNGTIKAATMAMEEGSSVQGSVEIGTGIAPATSRGGNGKQRGESNATEELPSLSRNSRRESPSFALVSSEERLAGDRN